MSKQHSHIIASHEAAKKASGYRANGSANTIVVVLGKSGTLFTFSSKLIESVRMRLVRLSPFEAAQQRARVTASTSIVKLEVKTI